MKWPWTKLESKIAVALHNLKSRLEELINTSTKDVHKSLMATISQFKRSEQTKYNRLDQRLTRVEFCLAEEIKEYEEDNDAREKKAAIDSEI